MRNHIEKYPKYQSHYSRRHTNKIYLQCHLNIKKLYEEYKLEKNGNKCGSYDLFKEVFNKTGYKFKNQNWIHVRLVILLYYKLNNVRITNKRYYSSNNMKPIKNSQI